MSQRVFPTLEGKCVAMSFLQQQRAAQTQKCQQKSSSRAKGSGKGGSAEERTHAVPITQHAMNGQLLMYPYVEDSGAVRWTRMSEDGGRPRCPARRVCRPCLQTTLRSSTALHMHGISKAACALRNAAEELNKNSTLNSLAPVFNPRLIKKALKPILENKTALEVLDLAGPDVPRRAGRNHVHISWDW